MNLNHQAWRLAQAIVDQPDLYQAKVDATSSGVQIIDLGVHALGGLEAGRKLAEICLAGLAQIDLTPPSLQGVRHDVSVKTDQPMVACMGSQYAGWRVQTADYFAMASGPMRACAGKEPLINELGLGETTEFAVGVLETSQIPPADVCAKLAKECSVEPDHLRLLVARTASEAGHVQIVARSVETALHKLHEIGFDLRKIVRAEGTAPLPPLAADDVQGIGRTNDAILYGGQVTLWVNADNDEIAEIGRQLPSSSSSAYGMPFEKILRDAKFDFYQIDPLLFSPAQVTFIHAKSGKRQIFGATSEALLRESFGI
ncbi:MAG: methenyltetrahydromethanopterin cyclohydrolase [Blastopirellula sp. JB062]